VLLTWTLAGGGAALLVVGILWAWRNRPVRGPEDRDAGETTYLQGFNIANSRDFGFYRRSGADDE
jgi:hypothetical protein